MVMLRCIDFFDMHCLPIGELPSHYRKSGSGKGCKFAVLGRQNWHSEKNFFISAYLVAFGEDIAFAIKHQSTLVLTLSRELIFIIGIDECHLFDSC